MDSLLKDFIDQIKSAAATQQVLSIKGGGTKLFYGNPVAASISSLETAAYSGVVTYEPSELVLTAKAGTPITVIEELLAQNGQMLAFEPPHFGAASTLGGCVASGLAGPRRMQVGPVADFVLGLQLVSARADILNFGGEVMKNVAGYDLSRLLVGSLGGLGLITQVSLKVLPLPYCELTTVLQVDETSALNKCLGWRSKPLPISATAWFLDDDNQGRLYIRLSGNESAVQQALKNIGGQVLEKTSAVDFWTNLKEQYHKFFQTGPVWRVSLPLGLPALGLGATLHECGGAIRWLNGNHDHSTLRAQINKLGGSVCLFRRAGLSPEIPAFNSLPAAVIKIHKRIKQEFDPQGVFDFKRLITQV